VLFERLQITLSYGAEEILFVGPEPATWTVWSCRNWSCGDGRPRPSCGGEAPRVFLCRKCQVTPRL